MQNIHSRRPDRSLREIEPFISPGDLLFTICFSESASFLYNIYGRLLLSIYSFDIYCPRMDRKSICTPLSARIMQMTRGIPLSPRPENRKNMTAASAAKRRSPPAVPAIAEGAVEKERMPSMA